jgi:curli production assembly/transport component CsgF
MNFEFFMKTLHRFVAMLCLGISASVSSTDLVYTPINPLFGGMPLNGTFILGIANANNQYTAPSVSAVQKFNQNLQAAILSRLSTQILSSMFPASSGLQPGIYDTEGFTVTITDIGNGQLKIETVDKDSGDRADFTINKAS